MRYGHTTGTKKETKGASDWYAEIEAANIHAVEDAERTAVTTLAKVVGNAVTALPEAASRIAKAAHLVQQHEVWPLTDGSYLVGSQSDSHAAHLVKRGPWSCTCADATYRHATCKHVIAVQITVRMGADYTPSYN